MKRYQECNKLIKLWRLRWMLLVPLYSIKCFFLLQSFLDFENNGYIVHTNSYRYMSFKECYSIAVGDLQIKMKYYYTSDEVFSMINEKYGNLSKNKNK